MDILPNAIVKGSVFFKNPDPKTKQVTLYLDGMTLESGEKLPTMQLACEIPLGKPATTQQTPPQATVTSTTQRIGSQVQLSLQIVVPAGDAYQTVEVIAVGPDGPKTAYKSAHAPGETVSTTATGTPPFIVQVYVAGGLVKQIKVPAQ